jgi:hypothetical protein
METRWKYDEALCQGAGAWRRSTTNSRVRLYRHFYCYLTRFDPTYTVIEVVAHTPPPGGGWAFQRLP